MGENEKDKIVDNKNQAVAVDFWLKAQDELLNKKESLGVDFCRAIGEGDNRVVILREPIVTETKIPSADGSTSFPCEVHTYVAITNNGPVGIAFPNYKDGIGRYSQDPTIYPTRSEGLFRLASFGELTESVKAKWNTGTTPGDYIYGPQTAGLDNRSGVFTTENGMLFHISTIMQPEITSIVTRPEGINEGASSLVSIEPETVAIAIKESFSKFDKRKEILTSPIAQVITEAISGLE